MWTLFMGLRLLMGLMPFASSYSLKLMSYVDFIYGLRLLMGLMPFDSSYSLKLM